MKRILMLVMVSQLSWLSELKAGPVEITGVPFTYTQDFSSLGLNNVNWDNDSTIPGWFIKRSNVVLDESFTLYASDGSIIQPASQLYHFGNSADRALGAFGSDSFYYGVVFTNKTARLINKITIQYDGEQWRKSGDSVKSDVKLLYRIDGDSFKADFTGWTGVSNGTFTAVNTGPVGPLNGNDPANRTTLVSVISDVVVAPGQVLWVGWLDKDDFGVDQGLAIDNVSVTFEEETTGFALELAKPNPEKKKRFRGKKGFKVKGKIRSDLIIERVEYAVAKPDVDNLLLAFTTAKLKVLTKGRLFKKGYAAKFKTARKDNFAGRGTPKGTTSVTLVTKITAKTTNGEPRMILVPTLINTQVK
ncbi:MAG: hypothetical protein K1X66_03200 [Verrucomicrobiae bacterium]|nr:hypothetical protein [Verrucomicrobiae bacterium]